MTKNFGKVADRVAAQMMRQSYKMYPEMKALIQMADETGKMLADRAREMDKALEQINEPDVIKAAVEAMAKIQEVRKALKQVNGIGHAWMFEQERGFMSSVRDSETANDQVERKGSTAELLDESRLQDGLPGSPREHGLPGPFEQEVLFNKIRPRSLVTIVTPHGSKLKGRAVMRGPAGWVLNLGGAHGTPGIATEDNVIAVRG